MQRLLAAAAEQNIIADAVIAGSLAQSQALWRLRETVSEAQRPEGGSIKHDVSVPMARIPEFLTAADAAVARACPGARPVVFGHFGDGNVHYNVTQPPAWTKRRFWRCGGRCPRGARCRCRARRLDLGRARHRPVEARRAARFKSPLEIDLMRRIKTALDPNGILNPGKLL